MLKERRRCALLFPARRRRRSGSTSSDQQQNAKVEDQQMMSSCDTVAVLRVKLHCPACVTDVTRSLQRLHGVMEVSADAKAEIMTVKGCKLEAKRLCDAVHKKTGKRCEVLLLGSMDDLLQALNNPPPAQQPVLSTSDMAQGQGQEQAPPPPAVQVEPVQDQSCNISTGTNIIAPDNIDQQQLLSSYSTTSTSTLRDASEPRIEIRHQTHTVIYGLPPTSLPMPPASYPYYYVSPIDQLLDTTPNRYQDWLSEENPNACKVM
ncbi:hypothetical protein GOP47_0023046 [Adiantum capillus-veneris]|uniref:HMA domain-containing protein n=1 Tax=Adiantum capillus-veneris TaxID=13818 RepID=A0A9D4U6Z8_ADICA|nr:hypothetical protein GOP47_0023046 [Adiantum capillus-veneris]